MSFEQTRVLLLRTDPLARQAAIGFSYWFVFLIALDPGDLISPAWSGEVLRVALASGLGALSAPLVIMMVRRFPVAGERAWRNAALHALGCVAMAFGLILASCVLAPLFGVGDTRPVAVALPIHLAANWLLLSFTLAAFAGLAHALPLARAKTPVASGPGFLRVVPVGARGRVTPVALAAVDWIETQGNYLALHVGAATHLIRETSVAFEAKLDPARFVRIHRRTIVAVDRVRELAPLANGDAVVRMADGRQLRVSRSYRPAVRAALEGLGLSE
jgi:hypothetical protein